MPVDYEKLMNLDYTAYERAQHFRGKLNERGIEHPRIEVKRDYEVNTPVVEVRADDVIKGDSYTNRYLLEGVTKEEAEKLMFAIWEETMEELE